MAEKRLTGVEPFNDFVFRSCYYHQLVAGLTSLGVEKDGILLNWFIFMHDDFVTEGREFFTDRALQKALGYRVKKCNINRKKLLRSIDDGKPVIVGVDSYYLESRPETYQKCHSLHFILAYGYNEEQDTIDAVDHSYRNGMYVQKSLSMQNVLYASRMQHQGVNKSRYACRILQKAQKDESKPLLIWRHIPLSDLEKSRAFSVKNLAELKRLFAHDTAVLAEKSVAIERYCKEMKDFYFTLSKTAPFAAPEFSAAVVGLIGAYNTLVSLFWKMHTKNNFVNTGEALEKILRRIDELGRLEEKVYTRMREVCLCARTEK
ncbi:MAG: BtrH N-terminal domain-containing protein [Clostridiales bacterium]|nr:BtrH N-terminal domain-containing protein [Clostridiales bacterium]